MKNILNEEEITEFESFKKIQLGTKRWELYENLISVLRKHLIRNKNRERDINIFMLKIWGGFSTKQIIQHPYYSILNENNINVIINRVRQNLTYEDM